LAPQERLPPAASRIIELDGLRGLACLVVLLAHYFGEVRHGSRFLALGWVGVDAFFVLSGFLIGGILLGNRQSENYFSTFYIRRGFRIFPIYYVTISIVLLMLWLMKGQGWVGESLPAFPYFLYLQNVVMTFRGAEGAEWLLPTWTLCVEEQFYLTLPIILYLTPPAFVRRVIISLIVSATAFRILLAMTVSDQSVLELGEHVLLFSRWDLLFFGVLGAYIFRNEALSHRFSVKNFQLTKTITLGGIAVLPILAMLDKYAGLMSFDIIGNSAIGLAFMGFIFLVSSGAREAMRFRSGTLRFFGQISYCLYLIHQPVAGLMHGVILGGHPDIGTPAQFAVTVAAMAVSVAIASASWRFLEQPLIRIGHRWTYGYNGLPALKGDRIHAPEAT
jgi:peptidoglycan/LPS O-acetylase OafA/YrhL